MKVTDNMVEILKSGGSIKFQNWIVTAAKPRLPKEAPGCGVMLFAISPVGDALELPIDPLNELGFVLEDMFKEINSASHLPKSALRNRIRLDTENRCQSSRCNPVSGGKSRLLFVSAGKVSQVIQVKCPKCGYMNTFWKNRIGFDETGALQMEAA